MPGYNNTTMNYKVMNANACAVMIGDQVLGFAQTTSPSRDFGTEALYGIGSAKPQEIQQLKFSMSISIDKFKLTTVGQTFFGSGDLSAILANNQFDIAVVSGQDLSPVLTYVGCVATGDNSTINANSIVSESITFIAMDILGPDGDSVMNSNSTDLFNVINSAASII